LGYVFALAAKASSQKIDAAKFLNQANRFLVNCNSFQIRLASNKFVLVCRRFKELSIDSNTQNRAIKPLLNAAQKIRPNSESLTPVHVDFLQICLLAKNYNQALQILETEIYDANQEVTCVTPKDMLLYYYYGGMIYTGLKKYHKAFNFFRMVVSAPAVVLSSIMVEAYKKYIFTFSNCLWKGSYTSKIYLFCCSALS